MKKKINFKKSWPYIVILLFIFLFMIMFCIGTELLPDAKLDEVIGNVYGYDITIRFIVFAIALYDALTFYCVLIYLVIKWCFKHIVIE